MNNTTLYLKSGTRYTLSSKEALNIQEKLPAKNLSLNWDNYENKFYLEESEDFTFPDKVYGNTMSLANRFLETFKDRNRNTGILLTGTKGSGKSLLAKEISKLGYSAGLPTILVNSPYTGDLFNKFISQIHDPAILLFDEFEKVYSAEHQEKVLTLFDGVFNTPKLTVMTCNNKWKLNENLKNRPGRLFYSIEYTGLDDIFVREYIKDKLKKGDVEKVTDQILAFKSAISELNFDTLQALVEELNRYGETVHEVIKILNIETSSYKKSMKLISIMINGKEYVKDAYRKEYNFSPTTDSTSITVWSNKEERTTFDTYISPKDIVKMQGSTITFKTTNYEDDSDFEVEGDITIIMEEQKVKTFDISKYID